MSPAAKFPIKGSTSRVSHSTMTFCQSCNKQFANRASFRTHRSRFHRNEELDNMEKQDTESDDKPSRSGLDHSDAHTEEDSDQTSLATGSETELSSSNTDGKKYNWDTLQTGNETKMCTKDVLHTDSDTDDETKPKKRKSENHRYNPYPPKNKDHHVYNKLSVVHDILKTHLLDTDKVYKFSDCYTLKNYVFDKLVPNIFEDDASMEEALTQEQFYIVQIVRDLKYLGDIHAVLNEVKHIETIAKITDIFLNKTEQQKSDSY